MFYHLRKNTLQPYLFVARQVQTSLCGRRSIWKGYGIQVGAQNPLSLPLLNACHTG